MKSFICILLVMFCFTTTDLAQKIQKPTVRQPAVSSQFAEAESAWVPFWTRFCGSIKAKNKVSFHQMISEDFDSDFLTNSDVRDNRYSFLRKLGVNNNRGWKRLVVWIEERRTAYYDVNGNSDRDYPRKGVFKDGGYYMEFGFFEGSWFLTTFYFADRI